MIAFVLAATLTFDEAYARALKAHGLDTAFLAGIKRLQEPARWGLPQLRFETSAQRGENVDLRSDGIVRLENTTSILSVDVPLRDRGARARREANIATDALLFRRRALDEADDVFRRTLDAFARLYVAERRIDLLTDAANRSGGLRERAKTMLAAGTIDNLTAAAWEEQALSMETQLVDLDIQRLDAEARLRQVIGYTGDEPIEVVADLEHLQPSAAPRETLDHATLLERKRRLALDELQAQRKPQMLLTGFGGTAGGSGIYGVRFSLILPSFDAARVAQAQLELEEAERAKNAAAEATTSETQQVRLQLASVDKRIKLHERTVELARARQQSVARLVAAGARSELQLVNAADEVVRRESDLLALRVERWKLRQTEHHLALQSNEIIAAAEP
jgi:outer membrane protein TolC